VTPPRRLVLNTDVLFSRVHHETYGRLGAEGVVIVIWSEEILAELERILIEHGRSPRHAEAVCNFVRAGFPGSHVEPKSEAGAAFVSDTADAHIAAVALTGRAEAIVTRNSGRLPERNALGPHPPGHRQHACADAGRTSRPLP
jgi:predicted nucleic acid-binding protein